MIGVQILPPEWDDWESEATGFGRPHSLTTDLAGERKSGRRSLDSRAEPNVGLKSTIESSPRGRSPEP
jgi:hypothetical protein